MRKIKLIDICNPKQWKTIATNQLSEQGDFPVYGANGIIGFYKEFNHEAPTVLITCRGATCGNVHISLPKAYINGNAMALDNLDESICLKEYLYYFLSYYDMSKIISGTAQPQITIQALKKINVKIYPIEEQKNIIEKLNIVKKIIEIKKGQIIDLDNIIKSQFVEMFGNPNKNEKGFKIVDLKNCVLNIENGKSFVCENFAREDDYPAILKLSAVTYGNFNQYENKALIKREMFISKNEVHSGDLLFTRKNTPELVGMSAFVYETRPNLMLPDIIFRINTLEICNKIYLWQMINHPLFRNKIMSISNGSAKSMSNISKENLMNLKIILPPIELQNKFAEIVKLIDKQKFEIENSLKEMQELYESLMEKYFG